MHLTSSVAHILNDHIVSGNHAASDYFQAIKKLVQQRNDCIIVEEKAAWQKAIDDMYALLHDEIITNSAQPLPQIKFGTSGWRGLLGKDINVYSVACVTAAILSLYKEVENNPELQEAAGVRDFNEMQQKGWF